MCGIKHHDVEEVVPPCHPDICPCLPGQLKFWQGLSVPKQLCPQGLNSQACFSTACLRISEFQTGDFSTSLRRKL